jgi:uncharacterized membrane protein required for colicin V production
VIWQIAWDKQGKEYRMVTLSFLFYLFIVLFAIIGAMRGWAKELLVTFSVILAMALLTVLKTYVPFFRDTLSVASPTVQFWVQAIILLLLVFFGYQTPNLPRMAGTRFARERFQDTLLGLFLGAWNGFLIVGTLWYFMDRAGYPFSPYISAPNPNTPEGQAALRIIPWLPPNWLGGIPYIYFAVIISFIFVIIVFL